MPYMCSYSGLEEQTSLEYGGTQAYDLSAIPDLSFPRKSSSCFKEWQTNVIFALFFGLSIQSSDIIMDGPSVHKMLSTVWQELSETTCFTDFLQKQQQEYRNLG